MTETSLTPTIAAELDAVLLRYIEAEEEMRAAQRDYDSKRRAVSDLDEAARRIRLSLFALEGKYDKSAGDANSANNERRMELRRASQ